MYLLFTNFLFLHNIFLVTLSHSFSNNWESTYIVQWDVYKRQGYWPPKATLNSTTENQDQITVKLPLPSRTIDTSIPPPRTENLNHTATIPTRALSAMPTSRDRPNTSPSLVTTTYLYCYSHIHAQRPTRCYRPWYMSITSTTVHLVDRPAMCSKTRHHQSLTHDWPITPH